MKKALFLFFIVVMVSAPQGHALEAKKKSKPREIKKMSTTKAIIETKFGTITLKFFPDVAPGHVKNFIDLAKKGFYDSTTFHRVIPGFHDPGRRPELKGPDKRDAWHGRPGYTIKAEFNDRPHKRGTLSMARSAEPGQRRLPVLYLCQGRAVPGPPIHRLRRGGERHGGRGQDRVPAAGPERQSERTH